MREIKIVFLDARTIGDIPEIEELKSLGNLELFPYTTQEEVLLRIKQADIVLTNKVKISKEHIAQAENLKLICITATGTDNVDVVYAAQKGIKVKNVKGYAVETVAQHTFAMILHLLHQIRYYDDYVKNGIYSNSNIFTHHGREFFQLYDKKLGIIGLGNIGKSVARIADKGFKMKVAYHSPSGKNLNSDYQHLPLEELLAVSDIISIHSSLNEHTHSLIDFQKIKLMKPNAILINMSRGGVIVESDLAKAIDQKLIRGAGIDVFNQEPLPTNHPYLSIKEKDKIVLTPHIAWAAVEARKQLMQTITQYIREFIQSCWQDSLLLEGKNSKFA